MDTSNAPPVVKRNVFPILLALTCSGCLVRHRTVGPPAAAKNKPLLTASKDELIARIHRVSDPIRSFSLRADMSPSVGALYGGELTDYATVRAAVLFERPDSIRVLGLDPVVHSKTIFDMVSNGNLFRVSIPLKNAFYIGENDAPPSSKNKLENLRPSAFLTSMIVAPPGGQDRTVLENDTDETKATYIVFMIRQAAEQLRLARAVYFDRYTLDIVQQKTFDDAGDIVSETRYSDWRENDGVQFPWTIVIRRPKDGYEVTMTLISAQFNANLTAQQFVLEQPPGAKVTEIK